MHRIKIKAIIAICLLLLGVCLFAETGYQTHTVIKGDNLYRLSRQYGVAVKELMELNNLRDDKLRIGQILKIKPEVEEEQSQEQAVQTATSETSGDWQIHNVKRGDNLYNIGKQYGVSVKKLMELNNLRDDKLRIGQILKIKPQEPPPPPPKKTETAPPASSETLPRQIIGSVSSAADRARPASGESTAADTTQVQTVPATPDQLPEDFFHIVRSGDNLYRISRNAGITIQELLRFNEFANVNVVIHPNQKIIIKDPATYQVAAVTTETPAAEQATETVLTAAPDSVLIEKVYIVQKKDNLYRIALNNNMTVEELKKLNNLTSNNIYVGQKLFIFPPRERRPSDSVAEVITEDDLKTKAIIREDLIMPVDGKILSEYGIRNGRPHKGIDLGAPTGSPIYAVLDGTVVYSGIQGSYGNVVVVEHPDFVMTVYAHNEKNLVSVGDVVKQGQVIATIGSTGNATAPHVHFEYRIKGKAINPRKVLPLGV